MRSRYIDSVLVRRHAEGRQYDVMLGASLCDLGVCKISRGPIGRRMNEWRDAAGRDVRR